MAASTLVRTDVFSAFSRDRGFELWLHMISLYELAGNSICDISLGQRREPKIALRGC